MEEIIVKRVFVEKMFAPPELILKRGAQKGRTHIYGGPKEI